MIDYRTIHTPKHFKQFLSEHKHTKTLFAGNNLYIGFTNENNINDIDFEFAISKERKKYYYSYVAIAERYATIFREI